MLPDFLSSYFGLGIDRANELKASYDLLLVAGSIVIACLAGYTFLGFTERVRVLRSRGSTQFIWDAVGSTVMGLGVWAMHFVAMLAYELPSSVTYDPLLTVVSVFPAIIGSALALISVSAPKMSNLRLLWGGICMGGGIGVMHYSGMAGMVHDHVHMGYDPLLWALSVLVAVVLALIALSSTVWTVRGPDTATPMTRRLAGSVPLGLAVSGMHYTAMSSTFMVPAGETSHHMHGGIGSDYLAGIVIVIAIVVIALSIGGLLIERRLRFEIDRGLHADRRLRFQEERMSLILDHVADAH